MANANRGWGGGVSFTSPFTSCLPLDPAPTSFQQRIKQLLTEEWCDWQVKVSFLVRRASVSVWPMSSENSHFTFQRDLNNFWISLLWNTKEISGAPLFTLFVSWLLYIDRGIKLLNKLAFECYVKFLLCCLCAFNRVSHTVPMSSVQQHSNTYSLQQTLVSDEGIFSLSGTCGSRWLLYIHFKPLTAFQPKEGQLAVGTTACAKTTSNSNDKKFWITPV